jgi:predicted dehydrogenase
MSRQKSAAKTAKCPAKRSVPADRKLRYGIIGAGGIAGAHVKELKQFADVEVVAAADVVERNIEKAKTEWGCQAVFKDWREMLKEVELDAVSVCTPNALHVQPTLDALRAGCHVMVEKPLAMNAKEGQKMVDLANKLGLHCTIAFQQRFAPETQMIKRAVSAGTLGDILVARVHAMRRRGIPNWGVFGRKELQGGGPMIDIGVHAMEMAHYAMGLPKPVAAVGKTWTYLGNKPSAVASMWPNWDHKTYSVEDLAIGYIRFENGAVMTVESMFAGHIAPEDEPMRFELIGTKGGARTSPASLFYDKDGTMINATPAFLPRNEIFKIKMRNFCDICFGRGEDQSPAEHGLMIQKMIDGIYESSLKGREVAIK